MDEKTAEDVVVESYSSDELEDELFFDDDLFIDDEQVVAKVIGDVYKVEREVIKGDWDVVHDDEAIRTSLIEYFEEEAIKQYKRTELRPIEKYRLVDRTDALIKLVHDYALDRMGKERLESVSQKFHPTVPSIAIRKRCFGEVKDLYGPPAEEPYGRLGVANIKYDTSNLHPHIRHYLKGRFVNPNIYPIIRDTAKIYTDRLKGESGVSGGYSFVKESKQIWGTDGIFQLHERYQKITG